MAAVVYGAAFDYGDGLHGAGLADEGAVGSFRGVGPDGTAGAGCAYRVGSEDSTEGGNHGGRGKTHGRRRMRAALAFLCRAEGCGRRHVGRLDF